MEVKEKLLEHKQRELETACAVAAALGERIRVMEEEIVDCYARMTAGRMTGEEFSLLVGRVAYLGQKKATVIAEKQEADARVGAVRQALADLSMEIKMFEKLKARVFSAARKAANRKEQKVMDDLALRAEGL